jgi:hypothetical protein
MIFFRIAKLAHVAIWKHRIGMIFSPRLAAPLAGRWARFGSTVGIKLWKSIREWRSGHGGRRNGATARGRAQLKERMFFWSLRFSAW